MNFRTKKILKCLSGMGLGIAFSFAGKAQSTLHCLEDGAWLPVFEVRGGFPYCFTGDELVKSSDAKMTMLANYSFGDSYLIVEIVENIRTGVTNTDGINRFTAETGWFQFTARVTAVEDVKDAYFVMRYNKLGDAVFESKSIGDMKAGKTKLITLYRKLGYEMPEQLHFYSGMSEIRTNLVPSHYNYHYGDFVLEPVESEQDRGELLAAVN